MIVDQKTASFLKAMNILKFSTFGGYSNIELIYGDISQQANTLTSSSVHKSFTFVDLMKFFTLNVNLSLIAPLFALLVFACLMGRKFKIRSDYIKSKD